jgi:hypothetical protein
MNYLVYNMAGAGPIEAWNNPRSALSGIGFIENLFPAKVPWEVYKRKLFWAQTQMSPAAVCGGQIAISFGINNNI